MKTNNPLDLSQTTSTRPYQESLRVRTDVHAGAWSCSDCVGTISGNQLFKPTCDYCRPA